MVTHSKLWLTPTPARYTFFIYIFCYYYILIKNHFEANHFVNALFFFRFFLLPYVNETSRVVQKHSGFFSYIFYSHNIFFPPVSCLVNALFLQLGMPTWNRRPVFKWLLRELPIEVRQTHPRHRVLSYRCLYVDQHGCIHSEIVQETIERIV